MPSKWHVYHISKTPGIDLQTGYIGVAQEVVKRFAQHSRNKTVVGSAIRKHQLTVERNCTILRTFDLAVEAYSLEKELRPKAGIGWNIMEGGRGYTLGHQHNIWSRVKMSQSSKGQRKSYISEETYKLIGDKQRGRKREQRQCPFCEAIGGDGNMQRWHFASCKYAPNQVFVNGYDIDGVLNMGNYPGIYPVPNSVIITGRSIEERRETETFLSRKGICLPLYMAPWPFLEKTREKSGHHKGQTIWRLFCEGTTVQVFFEDDWTQYQIIKAYIKRFGLSTKMVLVNHGGLVDLENVRHPE